MEVLQDTYKDTKIGRIPKDWDVMKLKDLGTFFKGQSVSSNHITSDGKPIIRYGDLYVQYKNKNTVTHFAFFADPTILKEDKNLLYGDILFTGTGETQEDIGKCVAFLRNDEAYAGGDIIVLRPNSNNVNSEVLSYILSTGKVLNAKQRLGQGSSIFHTYSQHLEKLNIPLPSLPEQQKIAAILSTVDEQISTTDKIIEKSKELKKGLMQKLFSEGIGHTEFKDTKIGRIPKDWEVVRLDTVSSKIGDGLHSTPNYTDDSDYYFVNGNNLIKGEIQIKPNTKRVTKEEYIKHKKQLTTSTILMSINGTIGNLAFCNMENIVLGKSAAYINLNTSRINKVFFYYFLQTHQIKLFYLKELTGTTIANLSLKSIRKTPTVLPSNEEQQKIADILSEADAKIEKEQTQKTQLETLKKGLMQQLLTGKKRVKV